MYKINFLCSSFVATYTETENDGAVQQDAHDQSSISPETGGDQEAGKEPPEEETKETLDETQHDDAPKATQTTAETIDELEDAEKAPSFCKLWLRTIWKMRSVYGGLAVHSFDVLTDILVIVQWWFLAQEDNSKHENIDPLIMAYSAIGVLALSRAISAFAIFMKERNLRRCVLQFFDLLIFEEIYESHKKIVSQIKNKQSLKDKNAAIESTLSFKYIRQFEAVFESIPQSVLQLVFVMRTSDINAIFGISIAQSTISMTNSIVNNDYTQMQDDEFKTYKQRMPPSFGCIKHALSRLSEVTYRIGLLSLFWTVCGGLPFGIMLAVDLCYILSKTVFLICIGSYEFSADTILLNLNQIVVIPSEEVFNINNLVGEWYVWFGVDVERDWQICLLIIVANCFCCFGLAAALSAFGRILLGCKCKVEVYPVPNMRIGTSLVELLFLIFYAVFAENGEREGFLTSNEHGLSIFIVTCISFFIYSQYLVLFPNFALPDNVGARSRWGYAYANELSELQRIKVRIPRSSDKEDMPRIVADFWDEKHNHREKNPTHKGLSAAVFALAKGNREIVDWLEAQGAKWHIQENIDAKKAKQLVDNMKKN